MLQDFHCWAPLSCSPLLHHPVPLISVPSLIPTSSAPGRADLQQKIPHSGQNQLNLQQFVAGLCWDLSLKIISRVGAAAPCNMGRDFPAPLFAEICLGSNYSLGRGSAPGPSPSPNPSPNLSPNPSPSPSPSPALPPLRLQGLAPAERPNTQPPGLAALAARAEQQLIICW